VKETLKMSFRARWLLVSSALVIALPLSNALADQDHDRDWKFPKTQVPLGSQNSPFSVTSQTVTPGVTYYQVKAGTISTSDYWTVNIGFFLTQAAAQTAVSDLAAKGFVTRFDPAAGTHADGTILGYWLSYGQYTAQADAIAAASQISTATAQKYVPATRNTALAGFPTSGPWIINVLAIKPEQASVRLGNYLPLGNTPGTANLGGTGETPSAASARLYALAGMNGGFFSNVTPIAAPLPPRSPVGTYVLDGHYLIPPLGGRPGVKVSNSSDGHPRMEILHNLTGEMTLTDSSGSSIAVHNVDRPVLGYVVDCGAAAETPSNLPEQDYVCKNPDALVMYDDLYLKDTASNSLVDPAYSGATFELVVDADGVVLLGQPTLGSAAPPKGGHVFQGLGTSATWLQNHSYAGTKLKLRKILSSDGRTLEVRRTDTIVECGPTLLSSKVNLNNLLQSIPAEGFGADYVGINNANWYNGFVIARNGRTMVGVAADGTILMVEIDGRQPTISLGTSLPETAAVMSWLGAVDAMNLDGGGSSNMIVNGTTVGHPSDAAGERGTGNNFMIVKATDHDDDHRDHDDEWQH
jgi:Phosphodiester glycosidase/SPOR domain